MQSTSRPVLCLICDIVAIEKAYVLPASAGEETTIPPTRRPTQYGSKYNRAILLDDFSFSSRRGQEWKIVSIDRKAITGGQDGYPHDSPGRMKVMAVSKQTENGLSDEHTLWINDSARV